MSKVSEKAKEDQKIEMAALDEEALEDIAGGHDVDGYEVDLVHL